MNKTANIIGKAKTVLVFGPDDAAKAIVSSIIVRVCRRSGRKRVALHGQVTFDHATLEHMSQGVLGLVDRICGLLDVAPKCFEMEMVTPGVASITELPVTISGFSADAPVFLALLSAALGMPLPQDLLTTGQLGSSDGELRPVRQIPAKLAAAVGNRGIKRFCCPPPDADDSLSALAPDEATAVEEATVKARDRLQINYVADVGELLKQALDEESVLLAALRSGFFGQVKIEGANPLDEAVAFLADDHETRFWRVVTADFASSAMDKAKKLLSERCQFHVRRTEYPVGLGANLLPLVRTLPATVRRSREVFPLFSMKKYHRLAQYASPSDQRDAQLLENAISGKGIERLTGHEPNEEVAEPDRGAAASVDAVLHEISAETLADKSGRPIDTARASYMMANVLADSEDAFWNEVASFYAALQRALTGVALPDTNVLADEAGDLLRRSFADKGGTKEALAEGRFGVHGGMRYVLDVMTDQFKSEQQAKRINQVVKTAVDSLDWDARVAFMKAFLARIGPQLSADIQIRPPKDYAGNHEEIIRVYAQSLDHLKRVLQKF